MQNAECRVQNDIGYILHFALCILHFNILQEIS